MGRPTTAEVGIMTVQALQAVYMVPTYQKAVLDKTPAARNRQRPLYMGLFQVEENLYGAKSKALIRKLFKDVKKSRKPCVWVICQGMDETHCTGWAYNTRDKTLYAFDPGSTVYGGEGDVRKVIKLYEKQFPRQKSKVFATKMQCDCDDTYCQSWSLMFLSEFVRKGHFRFVDAWMRIKRGKKGRQQKRRKIAQFMLKHIKPTRRQTQRRAGLGYLMLEALWYELREEHDIDVYWDENNEHDLLRFARLGFGVEKVGGRRRRRKQFRFATTEETPEGWVGIWPR